MDPTVTMTPTIKLYSFSFLIVLKVRYTISLVNYTPIDGVFECSYIYIYEISDKRNDVHNVKPKRNMMLNNIKFKSTQITKFLVITSENIILI